MRRNLVYERKKKKNDVVSKEEKVEKTLNTTVKNPTETKTVNKVTAASPPVADSATNEHKNEIKEDSAVKKIDISKENEPSLRKEEQKNDVVSKEEKVENVLNTAVKNPPETKTANKVAASLPVADSVTNEHKNVIKEDSTEKKINISTEKKPNQQKEEQMNDVPKEEKEEKALDTTFNKIAKDERVEKTLLTTVQKNDVVSKEEKIEKTEKKPCQKKEEQKNGVGSEEEKVEKVINTAVKKTLPQTTIRATNEKREIVPAEDLGALTGEVQALKTLDRKEDHSGEKKTNFFSAWLHSFFKST